MEISKKVYDGLLIAFVILLIIFFAGMYQYNEVKKEKVAALEAEGWICTKNPFGIYDHCIAPDAYDVEVPELDLDFDPANFSMEDVEQ